MDRPLPAALKIGSWILGGLIATALSFALLLHTRPGNALLGHIIGWASGGRVSISGLEGDLPDRLRADVVEISDGDGVWLRIKGFSLDWNAASALRSRYEIRKLTASKAQLVRLPKREASEGTTPKIDIDLLHVPDMEISNAVIGRSRTFHADGEIHFTSRHQMSVNLCVIQAGGAGSYRINGGVAHDVVTGIASIREREQGVLSALLGLPGIGPVDLDARASGNRMANRMAFSISAGAMRAQGSGIIMLGQRRADIDFSAASPAMRPVTELSWQSLTLDGHLHGAFDTPRVQGKLAISGLVASGVAVKALRASVRGEHGVMDLIGDAVDMRIPGDHPDLFAQAPVDLKAHADLRSASRPVAFALSHRLLSITGYAQTRGHSKLRMDITVPSLAPFAALANEDVQGRITFRLNAEQDGDETHLDADGRIDTRGGSIFARVLGRNARVALGAAIKDLDIIRSRVAIDGAALSFRSNGAFRAGRLNYAFNTRLADLSRFSSALTGNASVSAQIEGPLETATISLTGSASMASRGFERRRMDLSARAVGIPTPSSGQFRLTGSLNNAPVFVRGDLSRGDGGWLASLSADWKSLRATGDFAKPARRPGSGKAKIDVGQLADIAALTPLKFAGRLSSSFEIATGGNAPTVRLHAQTSNLAASGATLAAASIDGTISDPFGKALLSLGLSARKLAIAGLSGNANARISGPARSATMLIQASIEDYQKRPARIRANARLNALRNAILIDQLDAAWRGQNIELTAPATFSFAGGVAVDRLAIKAGGGNVRIQGRLSPNLAATVSLRGFEAQTLQPFLSLPAKGVLSADAQLGGTPRDIRGNLTFHIRDLTAPAYWSRPAMSIDGRGILQGKSIALDSTISGGPSARLAVTGTVPLRSGESMYLHTVGNIDLALINSQIAAEGRRLRGALSIDGNIRGTFASPQFSGGGSIGDGEFQDYARGVHLTGITSTFKADGKAIHIRSLRARAGPGTISGSGTINLGESGTVDADLQVENARPIASDLASAVLSGNVHVSGALNRTLTVSGKLKVGKGRINIPERFPPQVAILDVRRKGQKPPPEVTGGSVALDIALATAGPIFIRGRGIDADMSGSLRLGGTIAAPVANGGFEMNRGTVSLAGQTLTFTSGRIGFDGAGIRNQLDPSLALVAQTTSGGVTATLTVSGHASMPRIVLSSAPTLPQDEILAHLFFQQSAKQLTPLQLAQIAQAIATLGGIGTGFDPLGALRRGLRLDRLSVGSVTGGASGSQTQTTVEGGKYVARNVYVGAKQNLSGGTQLQVQVDLTKQLKAQATVNTGTNATATKGSAAQDNGSGVGLSYEFEY
jgi:translocation and assembly module TamB